MWSVYCGLAILGAQIVAKKKAIEKAAEATGRVSVIHLQGPSEEREWLTLANKKTRLPKATIVRIALAEWGSTKGMPAYPLPGGAE